MGLRRLRLLCGRGLFCFPARRRPPFLCCVIATGARLLQIASSTRLTRPPSASVVLWPARTRRRTRVDDGRSPPFRFPLVLPRCAGPRERGLTGDLDDWSIAPRVCANNNASRAIHDIWTQTAQTADFEIGRSKRALERSAPLRSAPLRLLHGAEVPCCGAPSRGFGSGLRHRLFSCRRPTARRLSSVRVRVRVSAVVGRWFFPFVAASAAPGCGGEARRQANPPIGPAGGRSGQQAAKGHGSRVSEGFRGVVDALVWSRSAAAGVWCAGPGWLLGYKQAGCAAFRPLPTSALHPLRGAAASCHLAAAAEERRQPSRGNGGGGKAQAGADWGLGGLGNGAPGWPSWGASTSAMAPGGRGRAACGGGGVAGLLGPCAGVVRARPRRHDRRQPLCVERLAGGSGALDVGRCGRCRFGGIDTAIDPPRRAAPQGMRAVRTCGGQPAEDMTNNTSCSPLSSPRHTTTNTHRSQIPSNASNQAWRGPGPGCPCRGTGPACGGTWRRCSG